MRETKLNKLDFVDFVFVLNKEDSTDPNLTKLDPFFIVND